MTGFSPIWPDGLPFIFLYLPNGSGITRSPGLVIIHYRVIENKVACEKISLFTTFNPSLVLYKKTQNLGNDMLNITVLLGLYDLTALVLSF